MGVTDPRKLTLILHDLEDELGQWSASASYLLQTARYTQNRARERADDMQRRSRLVIEDFDETEAKQRARQVDVGDLNHKSLEARDAARSLVGAATHKQNHANRVLTQWDSELKKAQAWQEKTQDRLRRAEAELATAEAAQATADSDLRQADAALRNCQNTRHEVRDNDGRVLRVVTPDCSGYVAAVELARGKISAAQNRTQLAKAEVVAARGEMGRAEARAQGCANAVGYAQQALARADRCVERSNQAESASMRSLEDAEAAQRCVERAGDRVEEARRIVSDINNALQHAEDHLNLAQNYLIISATHEESAQRFRIHLRSELQFRAEMLYALNMPDLGMLSVSSIFAIEDDGPAAAGTMAATYAQHALPPAVNAPTGVDALQRPDDLQPRCLTTPDGQQWEMHAYEIGSTFQLRIFNLSQRSAVPEMVTDGDSVCLDAVIEEAGSERTLRIERFDFTPEDQERGLAGEALSWSEALSATKGLRTCILILPFERVSGPQARDWYQSRGYTIEREGQKAVVYKRLRES